MASDPHLKSAYFDVDPCERSVAFVEAYARVWTENAEALELAVMAGMDDEGTPSMIIRMQGELHAFALHEVNVIVELVRQTIEDTPGDRIPWKELADALERAAQHVREQMPELKQRLQN